MADEDLTPQAKKALLVESYQRTYRAAGMPSDAARVEREVVADLELVDAADRAGELSGGSPDPDAAPRERKDPITEAERERGVRLDVRPEDEPDRFVRSRTMDANPLFTSERWAMAGARIARILEGAGRSSILSQSVDTANAPKLAKEYAELWAYFMTRDRIPLIGRTDHNPFRGLSDRDACRMLVRKVEDICDRSTGVLGPWYVK